MLKKTRMLEKCLGDLEGCALHSNGTHVKTSARRLVLGLANVILDSDTSNCLLRLGHGPVAQ